MDWDRVKIFHTVAEAGSFTHASELLNLSQSAISRQISALEESLGVPLFHRHARGLILTEQGELLRNTARDVFAKLSMAEAMLTESRERPKGPLKVTTTVAFGSVWLTPRIHGFLSLHPDVTITLLLDDSELDLGMREADIAIRMSPPRQPDLVKRKLMTIRHGIYASPDYVNRQGMPKTPAELDDHKLIVFGEDTAAPISNANWILDAGATPGKARRPILKVNNIYGIMRAVESGLGVASIPDYMVRENGNVVQVLPELEGPQSEVYFVYHEELRHSKRIAVFRDFLIREIEQSLR
ncbi:MAG: LysR family transcriptional regulator [Tistrella sp.]|jgi:DNA-binding transcriptional LysR family regulator|uniref:Redox-sensitive transcriptional activator n=2 Tax=Tistrella mobilis TaxID=171437 RepID=I3TVD9_TISMK|nr:MULTISPECIES: LysR family transcriptional regulator [Tistrella]AFK56727.1 redox-sensitive transcriptional activator [Tistrella mobilis KA081020-065]KYO51435.1 LysR family transcriptional regulator [Tistrella mobilis]MAD40660.1 LysR family transcriptional regulator [Tistrella sp.]MBA78865.1 LysR family transcriptional regulator [Tistrella sp.]HAE46753.1 LysR family transcriptional regulator [Tistrella mobilis]|tara:strand:- start:542 stop:1432 length:891 start_codon:yes stop_codon:yes gene_type:complete